jgi:hypothetical protein
MSRLVSPFLKETVSLQKAQTKYRFNRAHLCTVTYRYNKKENLAFYGNEMCQTATPFCNWLVLSAESN